MIKKEARNDLRIKRHLRIRTKLVGTSTKPRLSVFRSNTNIYCQVIDDSKQKTLVAANTIELKLKNNNLKAAEELGKLIAKKCLDKKIKEVVFDRSGYLYHGRVKMLADAAREAGLKF